jgi:hypothetical protein
MADYKNAQFSDNQQLQQVYLCVLCLLKNFFKKEPEVSYTGVGSDENQPTSVNNNFFYCLLIIALPKDLHLISKEGVKRPWVQRAFKDQFQTYRLKMIG